MGGVGIEDFLAYCKNTYGLTVYTEHTNQSDTFEKIFGIDLPIDINKKENVMIHELFLNRDDAIIVLKMEKTFDVRDIDADIHVGDFVHYTLVEDDKNTISSWQPLVNVWFEVTYLKNMEIEGKRQSVFSFRPSPIKTNEMDELYDMKKFKSPR